MEEKRSNGEISLTGNRKKVISSDVYTLKVPNFFTLPEYDNIDFELNSAPFEFADAIWRFRCKSREKEYREAGDGIKKFAVCLQRLDPEIPTNVVFYGIVLLDANDKEYDGCNNTYIFQKDYNEVILKNFEDSCPVFDRRNTLTLMIYLICVQRLALYPGEEGLITDNSQEPITSDKGVISLSRDFKDVLLNGKDHNVTFNVKDKRFRAHQDILRARSEVFCSMLTHDMIEKNSGVIDVPDCDPVAFEQLLCYVYTGRVEILDESNVFSLYYVADKYHIPHLKEECCNFITNFLTVTNIRRALDLALKHSDATLLESVSNYFFNNLDDILTTAEWELFMKEDPMQANGLLIKTLQKLRGTKA